MMKTPTIVLLALLSIVAAGCAARQAEIAEESAPLTVATGCIEASSLLRSPALSASCRSSSISSEVSCALRPGPWPRSATSTSNASVGASERARSTWNPLRTRAPRSN